MKCIKCRKEAAFKAVLLLKAFTSQDPAERFISSQGYCEKHKATAALDQVLSTGDVWAAAHSWMVADNHKLPPEKGLTQLTWEPITPEQSL